LGAQLVKEALRAGLNDCMKVQGGLGWVLTEVWLLALNELGSGRGTKLLLELRLLVDDALLDGTVMVKQLLALGMVRHLGLGLVSRAQGFLCGVGSCLGTVSCLK